MNGGNDGRWGFSRVLGPANDHGCSDNCPYRLFGRYSCLNRLSANPATVKLLYVGVWKLESEHDP